MSVKKINFEQIALIVNKINLLKKLLPSGLVFCDAGAKGGMHELPKLAELSHLHAFEPNPSESDSLTANHYNKKFASARVYNTALSDVTGFATLNIMQRASMSSLLEPDFKNYNFHFGMMENYTDWKENISVKEKIKVEVTTLDKFGENSLTHIDFLKLDTQGTELNILKGAQRLLKEHGIYVVKTEVSFVPVYKDQCLFSEVDVFLRSHNMILIDCLFYENKVHEKPEIKNKSILKDVTRYSSGGDAIYMLNIECVPTYKQQEAALKTGIILAELRYKSQAYQLLTNYGGIDESTTVEIIELLSERNTKEKLKRLIKNFCPPLILTYFK